MSNVKAKLPAAVNFNCMIGAPVQDDGSGPTAAINGAYGTYKGKSINTPFTVMSNEKIYDGLKVVGAPQFLQDGQSKNTKIVLSMTNGNVAVEVTAIDNADDDRVSVVIKEDGAVTYEVTDQPVDGGFVAFV